MARDEQAVTAVLKRYEEALTRSSTEAVVTLFASDGVLLAQNAPSSVGVDNVRKSYKAVFEAIRLNITFKVEEIVPLSAEWVMVRTTSTGTIKINANGATVPEANQELFLFKKVDGTWKIARYAFSTILPAQ